MAPLVTKNFVMIDVILSYNKANDTFFNSLRKNDVDAQVKITVKVTERRRVTCYCWTVCKFMYLNF